MVRQPVATTYCSSLTMSPFCSFAERQLRCRPQRLTCVCRPKSNELEPGFLSMFSFSEAVAVVSVVAFCVSLSLLQLSNAIFRIPCSAVTRLWAGAVPIFSRKRLVTTAFLGTSRPTMQSLGAWCRVLYVRQSSGNATTHTSVDFVIPRALCKPRTS